VRATEASQVYRGVEAETVETRAAARATAGEILTFEGEPILAVFHSTAGGRTATAGEVWGRDLPYLRVIEVDEEDDAPHTYWRSVFVQADLVDVLSSAGVSIGIGAMVGLEVTGRTSSGRVEQIEVRGLPQRELLQGKRLRRVLRGLGLRSTLFDIRTTGEGVAFVGSGHGHGVGMSQWGARALAERGASYQRILARFYPGTRLEKMRFRKLATPVTESFDGRNAFNPSAAQLQVSSAR
jgi:stage II sporulation protein D